MRVLHVTPTFSPTVGGIESVVSKLSGQLARCGTDADVAHVAVGLNRKEEFIGGTRVWRVPLYGHRLLGVAPGLASVASAYDLLHVHDPQLSAITANVALFGRGVPAVLSTHGGFWHTASFRSAKRIYCRTGLKSVLGYYSLLLASSKSDLAAFSEYSARVVLAENGVDVESFSGVRASTRRSVFRWIYWGRLANHKRIDAVIGLVARARALGCPIDLVVCGADVDRVAPGLNEAIARSSLNGAIRLRPALRESQLLDELSGRGVFVTASQHEGFGLTVIEAMAAGLLVICRDIAPLNEFVADSVHGARLAFDGGEADDQRLMRVLKAPPHEVESMSAAARTTAARYAWPTAVKRFQDLYASVVEERRVN